MRIGVVSVLFPTRRFPTAGIFVKDELDYLAGHVDIRLLAPLPNQHWTSEFLWKSIKTEYPVIRPFVLAFPKWFMQHLYPVSLALTLKRFGRTYFDKCNLIHAHIAFPDGVATVSAFGNQFPVIITVHGSDVNYSAMNPRLKPAIVKSLNRAERIICVSSSLAKNLSALGVTTQTEIIPNGIDPTLFVPGDKTAACRLLSLDPERLRILFAGNFFTVKGVNNLIKAMPHILRKYRNCELVLLGARQDGSDIKKYDEILEKENIKHAVRIVKGVSHEYLPTWMHVSDLLVLPSISEGFGLVAVEALACGRPVVATMSGGPEDIVREGMGRLVKPSDPNALAGAIVEVLRGHGILGVEILAEYAHSHFDYEKVTQRILDVYNDVSHS